MNAEYVKTDAETGMHQSAPGYVDPAYLQAMAAFLEQHKRRRYELLRLRPGLRVLDLGCGPATDTIDLAGLVGPTGSVIGVDHDPAMVAEANRRVAAAGVQASAKHIQADACSLPFESGSFDRVHVERVLQHLAHPETAFAELVRVTRHGGWIWVEEPDWGTLSIDSTHVDLERRYVRFLTDRYLQNGYAGRRLYQLFVSHCMEDIVVETHPVYFTSYAFTQYTIVAHQTEPAALAVGALTRDELECLHQEWQDADAKGCFFATLNGIGIVGRKS